MALGFLSTRSLIAIEPVPVRVEVVEALKGTLDWDWTQARTVHIPGPIPKWLTTMSLTGRTGTHAYQDVFYSTSIDGKDWLEPQRIPELVKFRDDEGFDVVAGDLWPTWHPVTGKVLVTGKTFNWAEGKKETYLREKVAYASMDPGTGEWTRLKFMRLPERDHAGHPILAPNAGCNQPLVLGDGTVLLPVRYQRSASPRRYTSTVVRCAFDGRELEYLSHGSEHTLNEGRGFYEPSLGRHGDLFFLTLRTDKGAWVTRSRDGHQFEEARPWTFDDGEELGSYNTQQHWVSLGEGLFLVYTRKGANNDHIFRHRAPLFIAQVDPERLVVIRSTERILLPENQATLGNSGVCHLGPNEAWVTCAEGLVASGSRKSEPNRVLIARIRAVQAP